MGKQTQPVLEEQWHYRTPGSAVAEGKASLQPAVQDTCHHLSLNISCGRINFERNLASKIIVPCTWTSHRFALQNQRALKFHPLKLPPNTDNNLYPSHLFSVNDYTHLIKYSEKKEREASPPHLKVKSQNHDEKTIHILKATKLLCLITICRANQKVRKGGRDYLAAYQTNTGEQQKRKGRKTTFIFFRCLIFGTFLSAGLTILSAFIHSSYLNRKRNHTRLSF